MDKNLLAQFAQDMVIELSIGDFPHLWKKAPRPRAEWWQEIHTTDAWIQIQHNKNRFIFSTSRPRNMHHHGESEKITVSDDRTTQAIAEDVRRRLLPNARAYFAQCRAQERRDKESREKHAQTLHTLEPFKRWKNAYSSDQRTEWRSNHTVLDIYQDKIYNMKIDSPTMEQVIKILNIIER